MNYYMESFFTSSQILDFDDQTVRKHVGDS